MMGMVVFNDHRNSCKRILCWRRSRYGYTGWFKDADRLFTTGNDLPELIKNAGLLLT